MTGLALAVLTASLLGSVHCAGMCGPLVAVYASNATGRSEARWAHVTYNAGRLACYAVLGAVAGLVGRAVDLAGAVSGIQRAAAITSGLLIAGWGLVALLTALGAPMPRGPRPPRVLHTLLFHVHGRLGGQATPFRALVLGLVSTLLPCGWLWAFVLTAAGTAGALPGALVMSMFWIGTLPVLLAVGTAVRAAAGPLRRFAPALCAAVVMAVGLVVVATRVSGTRDHDAAAVPPVPGSSVPSSAPCHDDR